MDLLEEVCKLTASEVAAFMKGFEKDHLSIAGGLKNESGVEVSHSVSNTTKITARKCPCKRKHRPGSSTELLHRKKAEVQALRDQVPALEEWLERLKRTRSSATGSSSSMSNLVPTHQNSFWATTAMEEFCKRRKAEFVHEKLAAIQVNQNEVASALLGILQRESALKGKNFVFATARTVLAQVDNSDTLLGKLGQTVPQLYSLSESVFSMKDIPDFGYHMQTITTTRRGRTVELVAKIPVHMSVEQISDVLWRDANTLRTIPDKSYRYMNDQGIDAVTKSFNVTIQSQKSTTNFHGLQYLRRFDQPNRSVHVRVSKLLLPTEGLQLCGHAWTVITATKPVECEVRFAFQLFVERQEGFVAVEKDIKFIQEDVLDVWSLKLRSHWLWQQELVADNFC